MSGFFSMDGMFYKFGSMLADVMILSFLWIIFSIPIFTMGASTTALFYVTTKRISNKEGYIIRDFWKSFKSNFKQATIVWLIIILFAYILYVNILNIGLVGNLRMIVLPFQYCFILELVLVSIYIFPLIARFDFKLKDLIKTAFFMANKHIFTSILCVGVALASWVLIYYYFIYILIAMGVYAWGVSYMIMKVFKKYRPEMDKEDYPLDETAEMYYRRNLTAQETSAAEAVDAVENIVETKER